MSHANHLSSLNTFSLQAKAVQASTLPIIPAQSHTATQSVENSKQKIEHTPLFPHLSNTSPTDEKASSQVVDPFKNNFLHKTPTSIFDERDTDALVLAKITDLLVEYQNTALHTDAFETFSKIKKSIDSLKSVIHALAEKDIDIVTTIKKWSGVQSYLTYLSSITGVLSGLALTSTNPIAGSALVGSNLLTGLTRYWDDSHVSQEPNYKTAKSIAQLATILFSIYTTTSNWALLQLHESLPMAVADSVTKSIGSIIKPLLYRNASKLQQKNLINESQRVIIDQKLEESTKKLKNIANKAQLSESLVAMIVSASEVLSRQGTETSRIARTAPAA